mmetsp:Transcript_20365/g.28209  ORF Transcript_20365/g.28209 Transcript_20365/m.28209 type:complete len:223 (-) Transcript_20365:1413-2081(-)
MQAKDQFFFLFFFLGDFSFELSLLSLSLLSLDSELLESELLELALLSSEELLLSLSLSLVSESESESETSFFCCMIIFGMFFKYSRKLSVNPPRPIEVKKLIAKRVLRGISFGNTPLKYSVIEESLRRVLSWRRFMASDSSWNKILIKMREEEVVSSSVITMFLSTVQGSASVANKCAKNLAVFLNLFVSSRWIMSYCFSKAASNSTWYWGLMNEKRWPSKP